MTNAIERFGQNSIESIYLPATMELILSKIGSCSPPFEKTMLLWPI